MTNPLIVSFAGQIMEKIGFYMAGEEGYNDDLAYLIERLQFLQNDTIDACGNVALGWQGQVRQWNSTGKMSDHDYRTNLACATVIERNIRELKSPSSANEDEPTPGSGIK